VSSSFGPPKPFVEILPVEGIERLASRWADLAKWAADPNPFAGPAFLIPAVRHSARRELALLSVWSGRDQERVDGLAILHPPLVPFLIVNVWRCDRAALPALLIDRTTAPKTISAIRESLAAYWPTAPALGIPWAYEKGCVGAALRELAPMRGLSRIVSNPRQRAALDRNPDINSKRRSIERGRRNGGDRSAISASAVRWNLRGRARTKSSKTFPSLRPVGGRGAKVQR
jgi:hypothetical protein